MLKSLTLNNFRQHENRVFNFTPGLNILRGANESGKSTIYEAIGYALFGSSALRESLDAVVTYDKPVGSLRVSLTFEIDGVEYTAVRGKSGAEITYADQRVSGQKETRAFVERLFATSTDVFSKLSLASQGKVKGVLSDGPTATNGLVETLANLKLIEELVDKVQEQLPSGNTTAVSAQIAGLNPGEAPVKPTLTDTSAKAAEIEAIAEKIGNVNARLPDDQTVTDTQGRVKKAGEISRDRQKQEERNISLRAVLAPAAPSHTQADIDAARQLIANSALDDMRRRAYAIKFTTSEQVWEGDHASFDARDSELRKEIGELSENISQYKAEKTTISKSLISGTTCPTCKQVLPNADHIKKCNDEAQATLAKLNESISSGESTLRGLIGEREIMDAIRRVHNHNRTLVGTGEYWELDSSKQVPGIATWKGEPPAPKGELPDVAAMDKALNDYRRELAKYEQVQEQLAEPLPEVPDVEADVQWLMQVEADKQALAKLEQEQYKAKHELQMIELANKASEQAHEADVKRWEQQVATKKQLESTLSEMVKHNDLIKKLRGVRPQIASKLWGTVLGAVGHYTTSIRGEASIVTRDGDGFKVNGRSVEGLSGSAQDSLGLGIRIALTKVFLPHVSFLLLDECFSACDDAREVNGLGTISAAGFPQCLLVTHSDLGDSLADNLITL